MSDEFVLRTQTGVIPYADEDATNVDVASRPVVSWLTSKGLTNAKEDGYSRNVQRFKTFRASGPSGIARRESTAPEDTGAMSGRRESPKQRHARQSSALPKKGRHEEATIEVESALQRYENAVLKYQKPKLRPKRQISRERQQQQYRQQLSNNCSSSDESVARNKSKSTSSIDTQSVNNILDEYEDLDYRRSSDLSDVGSISVTNFEAVMMDQQKRQQQQQERPKPAGAKFPSKSIPMREKMQPVLKVNQQTQVRQRSRDRQREPGKGHQQHVASSETETRRASPVATDVVESGRTKMPEILLRKGEVQKRVDEWLNQAHSQNFPVTREKPLTRSNSSAEQKSQRRYRQDSRSRSIDEARERLNGASSSYDDLSRMDRKADKGRLDKVNVGVNTSRAVYKEYLAVKNKARHDYGFGASNASSSRSGDSSPASRIPQRGALSSSFRSKRADAGSEETLDERNSRPTTSRMTNLAKTRSESDYGRLATVNSSRVSEASTVTTVTTTTMTMATATSACTSTTTTTAASASIIPCRRPSLKRSGNSDQNTAAAATTRSLVKEETESRPRGACGAGPSKGLGDQGELISPNKDGESRRLVAASGPPRSADKAVEVACCKSTEAPRCAEHPRDGSRIASPTESGIAIESSRRRLQTTDVRKEAKIDQTRQENAIYGAVGARVRALQAQAESRASRPRCQQVSGVPMESKKPPPVLPRKDLGASPSRDKTESQNRAKAPSAVPSSSFKPNNRVYTSTSLQQLNERNVARSKVATCEPAPGRARGYSSPSEHVERIYVRTLQPQVIHADDLESVLRPALHMSAYGEKAASKEGGQQSPVKETLSAVESELFERVGESRHPEHLETIEEDDRRSESSLCRYPEIGLKQCLKVQSLANGRSKETSDKRKDNVIYARWDRQVVLNEPVRTFATFQSTPPSQRSEKSSAPSRSAEVKESRGHEEIERKPDEPTMSPEDHLVVGYEDVSRQGLEQDRLTIHSRENSNLSTATIPVDELESQRGSRFKTEKPQGNAIEEPAKDVDVDRGAVVSEVLVKNLQFEQDLPEDPTEQPRTEHTVQQVNFHNVLCDDHESDGRQKDKKVYLTKEQMDHQRLITMLKKGDFETLKMVSSLRDYLHLSPACFLRTRSANRANSTVTVVKRVRTFTYQ